MARVTVEDCLENVGNHFDLVLLATKRARQLDVTPDQALLPWDNDKATVMALREIAAGCVDEGILYDVVVGAQKVNGVSGDMDLAAAPAQSIAIPEEAAYDGFKTTGFSTLDDQLKKQRLSDRQDGEHLA